MVSFSVLLIAIDDDDEFLATTWWLPADARVGCVPLLLRSLVVVVVTVAATAADLLLLRFASRPVERSFDHQSNKQNNANIERTEFPDA